MRTENVSSQCLLNSGVRTLAAGEDAGTDAAGGADGGRIGDRGSVLRRTAVPDGGVRSPNSTHRMLARI